MGVQVPLRPPIYMENSYKYFENISCKYYPCHNFERINCLCCFCPIYFLDCKGNYKILKNGVKDCSNCLIPHQDSGYDYIVEMIKENNEKRRHCEGVKR